MKIILHVLVNLDLALEYSPYEVISEELCLDHTHHIFRKLHACRFDLACMVSIIIILVLVFQFQ